MMDISPLNRPQTDTAPSPVKRHSDVSTSADNSNSFDQHLNERMDQARSAKESSNTEKNELNQESEVTAKESAGSGAESDNEPVSRQIAVETENAPAPVVVETAVLMPTVLTEEGEELSRQASVEVTDDHQILPQDGSDLPLLAETDADLDPVPLVAVTAVNEPAQANAQLSDKVSVERNPRTRPLADIQQSSDARVVQKETPALNLDDDVPVNPELIAVKAKQVVKSDDFKAVVNVEAKSASNSSVITTASLLQQVPGMTSVSAAHLAPTTVTDPALANSQLFKSSIPVPVQSPNWSHGVSERVAWMVQGNFQNAEIKLNPANLGPMEIKMSINEDQARITFVSAHAPVREALDQAIPRLREMLEQQGLNLADVDVSQYSESQSDEAGEFKSGSSQFSNEDTDDDGSADMQLGVTQVNLDSGVNLYA